MDIFYNKNSKNLDNLELSLDEIFCINHNWDYGLYKNDFFDINVNGLKIFDGVVKMYIKDTNKQSNTFLLIRNILNESVFSILNYDFTLLSELTKESPLYDKGRKVSSKYTKDGIVYVEKIFTDLYDGSNFVGIVMDINWYNDDNTIGLTKRQLIKKLNSAEVKTELRKRRARIIDYLISSAEQLGIGWFINILLKKFKSDIELFIENKTDDFYNSIVNETQNVNSDVIKLPNGNETTIRDFLNNKLPNNQFLYEAILEDII